MNIFEKIRSLPSGARKLIFWFAIIILGASLAAWWVVRLDKTLRMFRQKGEDLQTSFKKEWENKPVEMPKMPEINLEELKKLGEMLDKETNATPNATSVQ